MVEATPVDLDEIIEGEIDGGNAANQVAGGLVQMCTHRRYLCPACRLQKHRIQAIAVADAKDRGKNMDNGDPLCHVGIYYGCRTGFTHTLGGVRTGFGVSTWLLCAFPNVLCKTNHNHALATLVCE